MRSFNILETLPDMAALFDNSYILAVHDAERESHLAGPDRRVETVDEFAR